MQIGFIGLGSIGLPMAINLNKSGFSLKVHTRSRLSESASGLDGCNTCSNPYEVAKDVDILIICVTDDKAVEDVLFGKYGAFRSLKNTAVVIDFSTISYLSSLKFYEKLKTQNILYVDSPVTGGTEAAKSASLTVFVGGNQTDLDFVNPIYKCIGGSIFYFDKVGNGQKVKVLNQILVAGAFASLAEALALGEKFDLPMEKVVNSLTTGAGSSWALKHRALFMINDNYPLGFKLELHQKDLKIALDSSSLVGVEMPITEAVFDIEQELIKLGYGSEDVSCLRRLNK